MAQDPGLLKVECRSASFDDDGRLRVEISVENTGGAPQYLREIILARGQHVLDVEQAALARVPQIDTALAPGEAWEGTFKWPLEASTRARDEGVASILVGVSDGHAANAQVAGATVRFAPRAAGVDPLVIRLRRRYLLASLGALATFGAAAFMFVHAAADDVSGAFTVGGLYLAWGIWLVWSIISRRRSDRPRVVLGPGWLVLPERRRSLVAFGRHEVLIPFEAIDSLESDLPNHRLLVRTRHGDYHFLLARNLPKTWSLAKVLEAIEDRRRRTGG